MASFALLSHDSWKSCKIVTICILSILIGLQLTVGLVWCWHYTQSAAGFATMTRKALPLKWSALANPLTGQTSTVERRIVSLVTVSELRNRGIGERRTVKSDHDRFGENVSRMFNNINESQQLDMFLTSYITYCETDRGTTRPREASPLCPCVPPNLVGHQNLKEILPSNPDINHIADTHPDMAVGGSWKPRNCQPRQKIAIIIPYRGRRQQLHIFLHYMIPFLKRQLVQFTMYVVEQGEPEIFNKASLLNAGFLELSKNESFDCYFFHDVDTLPEDDRNFYTCTDNPRHLGFLVDRDGYKPYYMQFVGGGVVFTAEQFKRINGFSNRFYGWGGDDDDAYYRITHSKMRVIRFPVSVARYSTMKHTRDAMNPLNMNRSSLVRKAREDRQRTCVTDDGLTTLKYKVRVIDATMTYTRILVDLPPPPENYHFKKVDQSKKEDPKRKDADRKEVQEMAEKNKKEDEREQKRNSREKKT